MTTPLVFGNKGEKGSRTTRLLDQKTPQTQLTQQFLGSSCQLVTDSHFCACCVCASPYDGVLANWRSFSSTLTSRRSKCRVGWRGAALEFNICGPFSLTAE